MAVVDGADKLRHRIVIDIRIGALEAFFDAEGSEIVFRVREFLDVPQAIDVVEEETEDAIVIGADFGGNGSAEEVRLVEMAPVIAIWLASFEKADAQQIPFFFPTEIVGALFGFHDGGFVVFVTAANRDFAGLLPVIEQAHEFGAEFRFSAFVRTLEGATETIGFALPRFGRLPDAAISSPPSLGGEDAGSGEIGAGDRVEVEIDAVISQIDGDVAIDEFGHEFQGSVIDSLFPIDIETVFRQVDGLNLGRGRSIRLIGLGLFARADGIATETDVVAFDTVVIGGDVLAKGHAVFDFHDAVFRVDQQLAFLTGGIEMETVFLGFAAEIGFNQGAEGQIKGGGQVGEVHIGNHAFAFAMIRGEAGDKHVLLELGQGDERVFGIHLRRADQFAVAVEKKNLFGLFARLGRGRGFALARRLGRGRGFALARRLGTCRRAARDQEKSGQHEQDGSFRHIFPPFGEGRVSISGLRMPV